MGKHEDDGGRRVPVLANVAIVVVLIAWSVNFGARFFIQGYEPNVMLDGMLMAVLGFLLVGKSKGDPGTIVPDTNAPTTVPEGSEK